MFSGTLGVERCLSGPYRTKKRAETMLDIARYTYGDKRAEIIRQYLTESETDYL